MKKILRNIGVFAGVSVIHIYRFVLKPFLPTTCRFEPSCSEYTKQTIQKYGLVRGGFLGLRRIASCHPFSKKEPYDPVQ